MLKLNTFLMAPILISAFSSALIGCGTKGPLYIPEQRYPQQATKPAINTNKIDAEHAKPSSSNQAQPTDKE